jgi:phospho-N-acetylmuramoyl-pentapeptide-transferase
MLYLLHEYIRGWLVSHDLYRFSQVLDRIEFRALSAAALSFIIVLLLGPRIIGWLTRKKIGDSGLSDAEVLQGHAKSKANVPTMGGILIVGAICGSVLLVADISRFYVLLGLVVVLWHAILGAFDDYLKLTAKHRQSGRQGLYAWEKLIFQIGVGVLIGWFAFKQGTVTTPPPDARAAALSAEVAAGENISSAENGQKVAPRTSPDVSEPPRGGEPIVIEPPAESVPGQAGPGERVTLTSPDAASPGPSLLLGGEGKDIRHVLNIPFQRTYEPGGQGLNPGLIFLSLPLFILFATLMVCGMSNAVNITDGMDGLAAGVSVAVCVGTFVLCLIAGNQGWAQFLLVPYVPEASELAVLAGATAGACLGFLWWNTWPASVFMGDTGALALGGIIGYIAVVIRQEFVILVMCGLFLIEVGSVAIQVGSVKLTKRFYTCPTTGRKGFRPFGISPYHHLLHSKGMPEQRIVVRFWIVSVILVAVALTTLKMR